MHRLLRLIIFLSLCAFFWACASQTTPTGGPRDEVPPKLLRSTPVHKQKNYQSSTIELEFDELVNLYNPKDEILISPSIGKDTEFKVKKNKVTITAPKGWEENTTYSIFFREGIKDITEKNAPENLKLAFSTGPFIDSLHIMGNIKMATKETVPENITIALYKSDTFDIFKHTPNYFTISSKSGTYSLENIKSGSYRIYAFDDKNKNLKVESRTEKYGFLSDWIELSKSQDSLSISLINLDSREPSINNIRNNGLFTKVKFNKYVTKYSINFESTDRLIHSFGDDQSEIVLYNPKTLSDSLQINLTAYDSINLRIDTTFHIKSFEPKFIPSDFLVRGEDPKYNIGSNAVIFAMQLTKPLQSINYDSLFIKVDSSSAIHFTREDFTYDSIFKKLSFRKSIPSDSLFRKIEVNQTDTVKSKLDPTKREVKSRTNTILFKPILTFGKGALISIENDSSKSREFIIPMITKDQLGTLIVQTLTKEPHFVIQLTKTTGEIIEEVRNSTRHTFENLPAQNLKLRVIIDKNNNGKWDPGNIYQKIEPERVYFYQTADKKYEFPIRANWELGPLMLIF